MKETRGRKKLPKKLRRIVVFASILPEELRILKTAADLDHRPVSNFIAVLIERYCKDQMTESSKENGDNT